MNVKYSPAMINSKLDSFRSSIHGYNKNDAIDKALRFWEAGYAEVMRLKEGTEVREIAEQEMIPVIQRYHDINTMNGDIAMRAARAKQDVIDKAARNAAWDKVQGVTA